MDDTAVLAKEIGKLQGEMEAMHKMIDDLHGSLHRNGFRKELAEVRESLAVFNSNRLSTCPFRKETIAKDVQASDIRKWRWRKSEIIMGMGMLVLTGLNVWILLQSLPSVVG